MRWNRFTAAALIAVTGGVLGTPTAHADPYRWCAVYGGKGGGGTNCGFVTYEQCMATVSGSGGFCNVNLVYDGKPFDEGQHFRVRHHRRRR